MSKYIVADRSRKAITLTARCRTGELSIVRPVPRDFTLTFTAEQARTFRDCLAGLVAAGVLLIPSEAA